MKTQPDHIHGICRNLALPALFEAIPAPSRAFPDQSEAHPAPCEPHLAFSLGHLSLLSWIPLQPFLEPSTHLSPNGGKKTCTNAS